MTRLKKFTVNALSPETTQNIKGGLRYITSSRWKFEAKRSELQRKGKNMNITHYGSHYCIEW